MPKGRKRGQKKNGNYQTTPKCFFCQERIYWSSKPFKTKVNYEGRAIATPIDPDTIYEPCDRCARIMKAQFPDGITLIGATEKRPDFRPAICEDEDGVKQYPTGSWVTVPKDLLRYLLEQVGTDEGKIGMILAEPYFFTDESVVIAIIEKQEAAIESEGGESDAEHGA